MAGVPAAAINGGMKTRTAVTSSPALLAVLVPLALLPLLLTSSAPGALPEGNAPAALDFSHFPTRQHALVWRNWGLVEPAVLARVLATSEDNVVALAASMGLRPRAVRPEWRTRGYITLVRRNWHLLPYDRLLVLLDMPAERLEHLLREDDFLFVKLGNHKPKCERLTYAPPDANAAARAARIKQLVDEQFAEELARPEEPRFAFLERFSRPVPRPRPAPRSDAPHFIYSYAATFGDPLADGAPDPFPDTLLQELANRGVNGVWLHVVLRDLAPGGETFPEFGAGHQRRLANLRRLVARAARFGVGVYLYCNEPRAMPRQFFERHPLTAGVSEGDYTTLCTSHPPVRAWLADAWTYVFKNVPDLAGVFTITASENLTSCASHFNHKSCPRCRLRTAPDIITEVIRTVEQGVHRANPDAKVISWDWAWPDDWAEPVIASLPKNVFLQSVSEWSLPLLRGGVRTTVGEYCLSAPGPGPRATRHWALARRAGLRTSAKVQLNITWELSAVPWLPVLDLVAEHCANLTAAGVDGMQLSWSLGGHPSPNLDVASLIASGKPREQALDDVARQRYGDAAAPHARRAWKLFSDAFREYPYDGGVVYTCPAQFGPSNLLYLAPTGYTATMIGFPYDDLTAWRGPYPADVFASQFEKVSTGWDQGIAELAKTGHDEDLRLARAAGLHFRSVAAQARFVLARTANDRPAMSRIARDELNTARDLFPLTRADSRIGFEPSNHYYYLPQDLVEKVINCDHLLRQLNRQ